MEAILTKIRNQALKQTSADKWFQKIEILVEQVQVNSQAKDDFYYRDSFDRLSRALKDFPEMSDDDIFLWGKLANQFWDEMKILFP